MSSTSPVSDPPATTLWSDIRAALAGRPLPLTDGPLLRALVALAVPMVLEMLMESTFALVDILFVTQLGSHATATVGLTESMLTPVYAIAIGLGAAVTATVARRVGEKDPAGATLAGAQGVLLALVAAVLLGVPAALYAPELLALMDAEPEVVATGSRFATIQFASSVCILLLFVQNAVLRGAGDAGHAMRVLWVANGINLVLDPCLIFGLGPFPELGLEGAAVATTIGRGTGVLYQVWLLTGGRAQLHLRGVWAPHTATLRTLIHVSLGGILQFLIATSSWIVLMRIVAAFGSTALAGYTIAIRICMFALLPSFGVSNAAATMVGQNLGAGRADRAAASVWMASWINMGLLAGLTLVFVLVPHNVVAPFGDDPAVLAIAAESLRIISYGYPFYAWGMVLVQGFNGAGDTWTPTRLNLVCFWAIQVPLAWTLAHPAGLGADGVFWSVAGAESLMTLAAAWLFRRGRWREARV